MRGTLLTVGHSTHAADDFAALLAGASVELVADVRRHPGSRRFPWFGAGALAARLAADGIGYAHLPELGGRRAARPDSPNGGWENDAFRAYADHLATAEGREGLARLAALAAEQRVAVMCAEGPWWRCHRRLVADALLADGWEVLHLAPDGRLAPHELAPFARVAPDGTLTYPPPQAALDV